MLEITPIKKLQNTALKSEAVSMDIVHRIDRLDYSTPEHKKEMRDVIQELHKASMELISLAKHVL